MHQIAPILASVLLLAGVCDASCSAGNAKGSFRYPAANQRPRFRYWLPDGNVDVDAVRRDVVSASNVGAGGVEFLPFFQYGGVLFPAPQGTNWSTGAFGNTAFNKLFSAALESHHENGMVMDFALGPNQGQGVPSAPDNQGLQWNLVPHMTDVPSSQHFDSQIPGWGTGKLVSLVSAVVLSGTNVSYTTPANPIFPATNGTYESLVLKHDSLTDISSKLSSDNGTLQMTFEAPPSGTHYKLFAFYEMLSGHQNVQFPTNRTSSIFDNGSYTVDHFSSRGAQVTIDFWEQHILTDTVRSQLAAAGNAGWEDSLEIESDISWSPSMASRFLAKFGYDIRTYLPLLISGQSSVNPATAKQSIAVCVTDAKDQGRSQINDFRATLEDGYNEYIDTLRKWLNSLGVKFSNQPTYNLPMDMRVAIPHVDIPECESLGFEDNIDAYKQFTGAAIVSGRNVISNEMGAANLLAFSYTIPDILWSMGRAFASGVNQFVIHGQAFTGNYVGTTWPGHVAFDFLHADAWSPKRPDWAHGLEQALRFVGRTQYIQQQGVARSDIVIYDKQSYIWPNDHFFNGTDLTDIVSQGWCYHYLSPENFALPQMGGVQNKALAPGSARFQAVAVPSYENFTLEALGYLKTYAQAGLPIILLGGEQGYYPSGQNESSEMEVSQAFAELKSTTNVYVVQDGQLVTKLQSLGLKPRVGVDVQGSSWRTTWREDESQGISYAYIFNDGPASSGSIQVQSTGQPYIFDAWTGERTPLMAYQVEGAYTTISLDLAESQSMIIAFTKKPLGAAKTPERHVVSLPSNVVGYEATGQHFVLHAAAEGSGQAKAVLSDGSEVAVAGRAPTAFSLDEWSLTAELWEAPADFSDATSTGSRRNVTQTLQNLTSWSDIPALVNSSGVGYYSSQLTWPPANTAAGLTNTTLGAYIKFPPALNILTLVVNGQTVPPLDVRNPHADVTDHLVDGQNTILAIVPTTLWNYVRTKLGEISNAGMPPIFDVLHIPVPGPTDNGLVGPVTVVPFEKIVI